jgi:hypothetical protein
MSIITIQVFHQHYYDEVTQVKCSLSNERWRFESIINQLVIYSLHKPYSPAKVRYWSPSQLSRKNLEFARNHMYPGADRLPFGLIIAPPCPITPASVQCAAGNPLGPNNLLTSRSKGTLFGQLNVRHAFNMTRGLTTVGPNRLRRKALQSQTL